MINGIRHNATPLKHAKEYQCQTSENNNKNAWSLCLMPYDIFFYIKTLITQFKYLSQLGFQPSKEFLSYHRQLPISRPNEFYQGRKLGSSQLDFVFEVTNGDL